MSTRATAALLAALAVLGACYVRNLQQNMPRLKAEIVEVEHGAYAVKVYAVSQRRPDHRFQLPLQGDALILAEEAAAKLEEKWGRRAVGTFIVISRTKNADGSVNLLPMEMLVIFIPPGQDDPPH